VTLFVFVLLPLATGKREANKRNLTLRDDCRRKQGRGRTQGEMVAKHGKVEARRKEYSKLKGTIEQRWNRQRRCGL
jgi:hypothetical protein